ncbi:MAG TPA: hypothetical protein VEH27_14230 [Methylomirabilota bacterium]|nr:hypothetical protein [Methylomirabilota bacterium]
MTLLRKSAGYCLSLALAGAAHLSAADLLQPVDEALHFETRNGAMRADVSGLLDIEGYYVEQPSPALLFEDDDFFFNPRLSLFLDANLGKHFYMFVQARADRGFDPGAEPDGEIRADEYFVRYTPWPAPIINIQAGKFATVFGRWVDRHDSWNNPFINAPLSYEHMTIMGDQAALAAPGPFLARKAAPTNKRGWLPIIWGPSYATGASIFGAIERFDYAVEVKNAGLSSRPSAWDPLENSWEHPTFTGRLGYRPSAAWNVGASASVGAFYLPVAEATPGFTANARTLDDYRQITIGSDVSYAWHHWQIWGEAMASRFETPAVGDADSLAYFLEAKRKLGAHWFVAGRWNQQLFDDVRNSAGSSEEWDDDLWRIDAALGYRHNRHLQAKLQYSFTREHSGAPQQGDQLIAAQLTVKF